MTDVVDLSAPNPDGFTAMVEGTKDQWQHIARAFEHYNEGFIDRIVATLRELNKDAGGFAVDRLEHSLQTATRAYRDDKDTEYVVCALLHDIGDMLAPYNHDKYAAAVLQPFVSEANHWMIENHGMFQGYYFFEYVGLDKNMRDQFADHPHYDRCAEFCHNYDQNSFDPNYDSMSVEDFIPALHEVMGRGPRTSIYKVAE
ncbi:MAG: HD domain-containing protein [Acidimicrobiia bacterium]|nr:HD domain-containing protein [Acidimicrobiia bacterium]